MKTLFKCITVVISLASSLASAGEYKDPNDSHRFNLQVTLGAHTPGHPLMQALDAPQSQVPAEEQRYRRNTLGVALTDAIIRGEIKSFPGGVQIYVFGSAKEPTVYATNGRKYRLVKEWEDVTGKADMPDTSIGKPSKVYRVSLANPQDIAVVFSFPREGLDDATFLVCSSTPDKLVYPSKPEKGNAGMWVQKTQMQAALHTGKLGFIIPMVLK